jgi:hypothetical protein
MADKKGKERCAMQMESQCIERTGVARKYQRDKQQVAKLEQEAVEAHSGVRYYELAEQTGREASQEDWDIMEDVKQLLGQSNAYRVQEAVARTQAQRLDTDKTTGRQLRETFVKLFNTSKLGLNVVSRPGVGPRESSDQSAMRQEMIKAYHPADWASFPDCIERTGVARTYQRDKQQA